MWQIYLLPSVLLKSLYNLHSSVSYLQMGVNTINITVLGSWIVKNQIQCKRKNKTKWRILGKKTNPKSSLSNGSPASF